MLGSRPAPGRRTGAGATGARSRSPFRRLGSPPRTPPSPSPATSRRPALCPDSRPSHPPPHRRQKEGSAGSQRGRRGRDRADPSAAAPHTKGLLGPGRRVGAHVPDPRASSHPPAGVCASVHRNAGAGGACGSRATRAGRGGPEGRVGERPEGRGVKASEAGTAPGGRRTEVRGGGRGRQPGSPTSARRSVRPGLRAPSSQRGGRGGGGRGAGRGRGGAGERGGGSDPRLQPAPETRRGPRDPQEVCNDTSYDAHRARSCRCPGEMWTYPPTTHTRAGASSPHPDRCGTHDLWHVHEHR
ncbi:uncharacterized protein LOC141571269 [Rhinolophus sinicus]|uniref:uncharacterized protein LOC141571269 n=1 Tax=Rhinolophus sinicus TaxID=89399 RepID=UPI003D7BF468